MGGVDGDLDGLWNIEHQYVYTRRQVRCPLTACMVVVVEGMVVLAVVWAVRYSGVVGPFLCACSASILRPC